MIADIFKERDDAGNPPPRSARRYILGSETTASPTP